MKTATEFFTDEVKQPQRDRGCSWADAWHLTKFLAPSLHESMENEGRATNEGLANIEQAKRGERITRLANAAILDGASPRDAIVPGWAFEAVGVEGRGDAGGVPPQVAGGQAADGQPAGAIFRQAAAKLQQIDGISMPAAFGRLREIVPEMYLAEETLRDYAVSGLSGKTKG